MCQVYDRAALLAHQGRVRLLVEQDGTRETHTDRKMPGIGDMLGVSEIKEVKGRPRQAEARELLQKLADQVSPTTTELATAAEQKLAQLFASRRDRCLWRLRKSCCLLRRVCWCSFPALSCEFAMSRRQFELQMW